MRTVLSSTDDCGDQQMVVRTSILFPTSVGREESRRTGVSAARKKSSDVGKTEDGREGKNSEIRN